MKAIKNTLVQSFIEKRLNAIDIPPEVAGDQETGGDFLAGDITSSSLKAVELHVQSNRLQE